MALLGLLGRLRKVGHFELGAAYVHHGTAGISPEQKEFRHQADVLCEAFCQKHEIPFYRSERPTEVLKNEADLRRFRYGQLRQLKQNFNYDLIVTAHHRDDVLETQVLRLMRGVGKEGLRAIQLLSKDLCRPALFFSKKDLEKYATEQKILYLHDPSNADTHYLRNWVRVWLAAMEEKQPGVLNSFARSLENVSERKTRPLPKELWIEEGISRSVYFGLSQEERRLALVEYHKRHNLSFPRQTQFKEILRQLDMSKNEHIFLVGPYEWRINASRIWVCGRK